MCRYGSHSCEKVKGPVFMPRIDHVPGPLGQGDILLANWFTCITINLESKVLVCFCNFHFDLTKLDNMDIGALLIINFCLPAFWFKKIKCSWLYFCLIFM